MVELDETNHEDGQASNFSAYFNIVCVIAGTGVLQMGYTFTQSGWFASIITLICCLLCIYTGHLLILCLYHDKTKRLSGYSAVGEAAFGKLGYYVVQGFQLWFYFGVGCIFIMLISTNLKYLIDYAGADINLKIWTIISASIICIPFVLFKTMKEVHLLAIFGAFSTLFTVVVIVVMSLINRGKYSDSPDTDHKFIIASGLPITLASVSLSFGGSPVFPSIEKTMRTPKAWPTVLSLAMLTTLVMYMAAGVFSYLTYGQSTISPVLDKFQMDGIIIAARTAITLHIVFASPLILIAFALDIEKYLHIDQEHMSKGREFFFRCLLRLALMVIFCLVSMFVPAIGDFMSLIGALMNTQIIFVFPVAFYLKLFGWRNVSWYHLVLCAITMIIGWLSCVIGTIDSIKNLIRSLS
ncbi:hypothetical protein K493DRAFT_206379 [Basidiobolus meristosporus CBS 931.73]|uniref:Amino acid transporter transmembrane domain-containing protein n=1 Tax=Basidiobolus meristosporus CBS 931.73 TaxID=1314790 RepID=A0A1Y1Z0Z9_9FUNG|nr:hypothetical protein K493DRAFT_206379 [Basidiobolus meristosporus CBS 931.73]|eukprot:ORY03961.1 hypothetical protein K493DRAFT_206379 [Basidiobolus meristosporus CBS 931.73]